MWPVYHRNITNKALESTRLNVHARSFIAMANADSDHHAPKSKPQHFQEIWTKSISFYVKLFKLSVKCARKEDFSISFYILGRAFHCLQDFYAHTNWVFIDRLNSKLWDGAIHPDVKLSKMTPQDRMVDNVIWGWSKWQLPYEDPRELFDDIVKKQMEHPDMHLDFRYSIPSQICKKFLARKMYGYDIAWNLAKKHTTKEFNRFIDEVIKNKKHKKEKFRKKIFNHKPERDAKLYRSRFMELYLMK